jgi:hypothetical protein
MFIAVSKQNMGSRRSAQPASVLQQLLLARAAMRASFSSSVQANSCSQTCARQGWIRSAPVQPL